MTAVTALAGCGATYPAATLTDRIPELVKEEHGIDVTATIVGKTLWVYVPMQDLIDEKKMTWQAPALERLSKVIGVVHRMALSTDAHIDFLVFVAADVKYMGLEFIAMEYLPDLKEAMLERFSRGEYFLRSVRDVGINPEAQEDATGASRRYHDVTFDEFVCLQIIHRVKSLFARDESLAARYEIRSTSWSQKFGVLKIDIECIKKRYDQNAEADQRRPLDLFEMIAAQVVKTYDYYGKFQAIELADSFADDRVRLTPQQLREIKIDLPEFRD
ncbi:MAG: hypothetical protein ACM3L6_06990 [Deltaproteobacteria bacterium]